MSSEQLTLAELEPEGIEAAVPVASPRPAPTPEQEAAVGARQRDAFLEAGAGTGKTTVLVDRYCASIVEDGVDVDRLLAFTFTERAAAEMRTRIRGELGRRSREARNRGDAVVADELLGLARATERAWVMTIHAFCRRLLAAHPLAAGLDPAFAVLDANQAARLRDRAFSEALEALLAAGDEPVARAAAAYQPWRLAAMTISAHERLRSQGMTDPRLPEVGDPVASAKKAGDEPEPLCPAEVAAARDARAAFERLLEGMHERYERLKEERSSLDFADLELRALELLRSTPALASVWGGRFDQIMVDEFQDTNRVQLALVELLRGPDTTAFMVGDENQSIYRFRNADLEVFRREREAARTDPDRDVLPLLGNFRSRPAVLAAVNAVGGALLEGFAELSAGRVPDDGPGAVELLLTLDEGTAREARKWAADGIDLDPAPSASSAKVIAEARFLAERLRQLVETGEAERGEIVVLLRAFTHVDAYEAALGRFGLRPFVVGGRGYWTQQQVEDLIRLLGVVSNPLDDERLFGALASFASGVSPDALWLLRNAARTEAGGARHVWPVLEWRFGGGRDPDHAQEQWLELIGEEDAARLERFCATVARLRRRAPLLTLEDLVERTMSEFGYDLGLLARRGGVGRMANVRKLMRLARDYEASEGRDLTGFLALAAQSTERDEREGMAAVQAEGHDGVRVMTVHAAKGLQFPVVAVPDLGRGLAAGRRHADMAIGPPPDPDDPGGHRFGMQLAFPAAKSFGLWELADLNRAESEADAEEGCRLAYVAASRAEDRLILSGAYKPGDLVELEEQKPGDTALRRLLPALAAQSGWDGGAGLVTLPGPRPVASSDRLPAAALEVRISEPSPERAAELVRRFAPPAAPEPLTGVVAPPPLVRTRESPVPVGHLSYSALALYERCGYRFYVERVLGARETALTAPASADRDDDGDELTEPEVPRNLALGIGNAVHAALEWSAGHAWETPPDELLERMLAREGLHDAEAARRSRALIDGWLVSPLRAELSTATVSAELPFVLGLGPTVIRGQIDLLAERPDKAPTVVDYKTDALAGRAPAELAGRYRAQREIYALAAGDRGATVAHVFLERPDEPVIERVGPDQLDAVRSRLEGLVERMRAGEFTPAEDAYAALCFGCPAAARLCPNAKWKPPSP